MYHVNDMMAYLNRTFGAPDITVKSPHLTDFNGKQGILLIQGHGWKDAGVMSRCGTAQPAPILAI